jgi:hypothetical protein
VLETEFVFSIAHVCNTMPRSVRTRPEFKYAGVLGTIPFRFDQKANRELVKRIQSFDFCIHARLTFVA